MLNHISRIGIFMIAAQAMVHFAPGKQYEKYIKSVAGIIILFLFLKPFLLMTNVEFKEPEAVLEWLEELADTPDIKMEEAGSSVDAEVGSSVDAEVVRRMEEEVKKLLSLDMEGEEYCVSSVSLRFVEDQELEQKNLLSEVEVCIEKRVVEKEEGQIEIEKIVVAGEQKKSLPAELAIYQERFAQLLGIEKERVEVRQVGRSKKAF